MEIHPIRTEADYREALSQIEQLFEAAPGTPEEDRLDVMATLVQAYEEEHDPIPLPDPIEAMQYFIESRRLSPRDLEAYLGDQERVASILNRASPLTLDMIRRLHAGLGMPADVLIQPYAVAETAA